MSKGKRVACVTNIPFCTLSSSVGRPCTCGTVIDHQCALVADTLPLTCNRQLDAFTLPGP